MAITTGKVRASYVNIFQPRIPENGGEPKYSVMLLIPKSDTATINAIYGEIEKAKQEGAQKVFNGNIPPVCRVPLYDGDGYRPSGEPFGAECKGHMVITASAKMPPSVVGLDMQNIINPAEVYSGCYIRANINFFAYNSNGNKGIGCGLNAVQKIEDGEPLTARVSAEEAFGGSNAYGAGSIHYLQGTQQTAYPAYGGTRGPAGYGQTPPQAGYGQIPLQTGVPGVMPQYMPQQVQAPVYQTQGQIDPITGKPLLNGGIIGLQ